MNCPNCRQSVLEGQESCPNCGYDLSVYWSIHTLKDNIWGVKKEAHALSSKIDLLTDRFSQLERAIVKSISEVKKPEIKPQKPKETFEDMEEFEIDSDALQDIPTDLPQQDGQSGILSSTSDRRIPKPEVLATHKGASEVKFGQKWLLIAGIVTTVLAVGWFLKYSFDQNWIGPAGRVTMAYLLGVIFLGSGEFCRRKDYHFFGLYLIGGGLAMLYFATYAAFQIYYLLSQPASFGVMVLITLLSGTLALFYDTKWLAVLGLIGGFLTPVILSTGHDHQLFLMTYMLILNTGILYIAFFKQWGLLSYLGFFFTWMLFSGWYAQHYTVHKFWKTMVFLNLFFLNYAFVPFVYHVLKDHGKMFRGAGIIMLNAFIAFGYAFTMIREYSRVEYVSIVTIIYAGIFLWMAQSIYRRDPEQVRAFVLMIAEATLFLVLTVPILFSDHWITDFWAIQAAVVLWASIKLRSKWIYNSFLIIFLITLIKFLTYDYTEVFHLQMPGIYFWHSYGHLLMGRFFTSFIVLGTLFLSAYLVKKEGEGIGYFHDKDAGVFLWTFGVLLFIVLNIEVGAFFHDYAPRARFAAISVLWTLFSIALIAIGFLKNNAFLRQFAIGLFGVTMVKVFFIDMSNVSTPYRIISFTVLGVMLIGASYLYHRYKDRILPAVSENGPPE